MARRKKSLEEKAREVEIALPEFEVDEKELALDQTILGALAENLTFAQIAKVAREAHGVGQVAVRNSITRMRTYQREREDSAKWKKRQDQLEWLHRTRRKAMQRTRTVM